VAERNPDPQPTPHNIRINSGISGSLRTRTVMA